MEAGGEQRGEGEEKTGSPLFGRRMAGSGNVPKVALLASPFMTRHTCSGDPGGEVASHIGSVHIHTRQAPSQATGGTRHTECPDPSRYSSNIFFLLCIEATSLSSYQTLENSPVY